MKSMEKIQRTSKYDKKEADFPDIENKVVITNGEGAESGQYWGGELRGTDYYI